MNTVSGEVGIKVPRNRKGSFEPKIIFSQITKNKPSFTNGDSPRKMLYMAS